MLIAIVSCIVRFNEFVGKPEDVERVFTKYEIKNAEHGPQKCMSFML